MVAMLGFTMQCFSSHENMCFNKCSAVSITHCTLHIKDLGRFWEERESYLSTFRGIIKKKREKSGQEDRLGGGVTPL